MQATKAATTHANGRTGVLFVDTTPFFGPLMQVHSTVMKHLDRSAYRVLVASFGSGDYTRLLADSPDVTILRHPAAQVGHATGKFAVAGKAASQAADVARYVKAGWAARREGVGIVHVGMTRGMLVAGHIIAGISGARLVVHVHSDPSTMSARRRAYLKVAMRRAAAVVTVSSFVKEQIVRLGVPAQRVWPVLNTVDLERFDPGNDGSSIRNEYGIPDDDVLVLCLGRLFAGKGQLHLVRALGLIKDEAPQLRALIVGWEDTRHDAGRSYRDAVLEAIRALDLEDRVIVDAARPEAPQMMAAADIVAVPSVNDPCPLTVLEAMASGKPVAAFRSGGIPEELGGDAETLVDSCGHEELAQVLVRLARDASLRTRLGERNRRRAKTLFSEERLAADVSEVYQRVLGGAAATTRSRTPVG